MDQREAQWKAAVLEAQDDVAQAPTWQAEKTFRWHLSQLIAWGKAQGYSLATPPV